MMYLLSRQEMYACDRYTIQEMGIPGKDLMENAGRGSAEYLRDNLLTIGEQVLIFCGSGNNGGDGFVIGRYLHEWGYHVQIIVTGKYAKMTNETLENYDTCLDMGISIHCTSSYQEWHDIGIDIGEYGIVVDAIFGVGFKGILRGWIAELIREINQKSKLTIAIDIASGIDADNGAADNAVQAQHTLTMAAIKYGSVLGAGKSCSGRIEVIDIGMPPEVTRQINPAGRLVNSDMIKLPERKDHYHKGNYGRIAIIAGSPGFSGAAVLAARAALRSGAGLITLFHPQGMEIIFEIQLLEVMTRAIPIDFEELEEQLAKFDVVLFGPGVGVSDRAGEILEMLVHKWQKPLIIDADGLNLLSIRQTLLPKIAGRKVLLTPHIGEFSRLSGIGIKEIMADPAQVLMSFCREKKLKVLLKSSTTILCDGEQLIFDESGNDGLATGGSGDVLSGMICSFAGQGLELAEAGIAASWVLGKTAEKLAEQRETRSIIPSEIIDNLFKY
jgi:ADP-dependent NAD(P)H-hydrate dehydratase / NAD(P)H-hydrate epimerase